MLAHQVAEQVEDLGLDHDVESRRRLVGDDQARVAREGHRDHHALPLPAGELVGVRVGTAGGESDPVEQVDRAASASRA